MDVEYLKEAARAIEAKFPDNHGFILFVAPYGDAGKCRYIASIDRRAAINLLKEWLIKASGEEEWMRHLE